MIKKKATGANLKSLMDALESSDGMARQKARLSLVTLGKPAVPSLLEALQDSKSHQLRWEAAKALGAIGDARSIPLLVKVLGDSDADEAWLAAEALKGFKKIAWPALLNALMEDGSNAVILRQRAHNVFRNQDEKEFNDLLAPLIKSLEIGVNREAATVAAYEILKRMKFSPLPTLPRPKQARVSSQG
jgi:HEAT repeat protein